MVWLWACVFLATLIIEIFTIELFSIWFSVGGLVAFILALCTKVSPTVQILVFLAVSLLLLICMRKICMKLLKNTKEKTNMDLIVGLVLPLKKSITEESAGEVVVNGVVWRAVSVDKSEIEEKSKVKVVKVDGNKLVVEKIEKEGDK